MKRMKKKKTTRNGLSTEEGWVHVLPRSVLIPVRFGLLLRPFLFFYIYIVFADLFRNILPVK